MAKKFLGGRKISGQFFDDVAEPILASTLPRLGYSAALIGPGSEVLGFDTEISTDHDWRPRFFVFLSEADLRAHGKDVETAMRTKLPETYRGYSVRPTKEMGDLRSRYVYSVNGFLKQYLTIRSTNLSVEDWLTVDEHRLLGVTSGTIFRDDGHVLELALEVFRYYPRDVWLYLIASQWAKIAEEEAFVGRAGETGDELGSQIIATRIVQSLMRLCFLMEQAYVPYSKWFGAAFKKLRCGKSAYPIFEAVLSASTWKEREQALSKAYAATVRMHNRLSLTGHVSPTVRQYHERPYRVIGAYEIAHAVQDHIKDPALRARPLTGSVNQFSDSAVLVENDRLRRKLKTLYRS